MKTAGGSGFGRVAGVLLVAAALSACGGGGGGARPTATRTPMAPATATLIPTTTPVVPTATFPVPTDTPVPPTTATEDPTPPPPTDTFTPQPTETSVPALTNTPTQTPLVGPVVTAFGIADSSGTFNQVAGTDAQGRSIYPRQSGSDFLIYVEGRPGPSRLPVGTNLLSTQLGNPIGQPDLQIVASRPLGNGSAAVCDKSFPDDGGVPAIDPPDFGFVQSVSDALNDFSCRFRAFSEADFACTQDNSGSFLFGNGGSTVQFCTLVNEVLTLPTGDTVLTVRLRDTAGQAGPSAQIVVRVRG